jgi:hypothetical protein
MWMFTQTGFFSVVQDRNDKSKLHIRARFREDLERLRAQYIPKLAIKHTPQADYAYRAEMSRRDYVLLASALAAAVDYPNFKDRVTDEQGHDRHMLYMDVWTTMLRAQRDAERMRSHGVRRLAARAHDELRPLARELEDRRLDCPECQQSDGASHMDWCSMRGTVNEGPFVVQGALVDPAETVTGGTFPWGEPATFVGGELAPTGALSPEVFTRAKKAAKKKAAKKNAKARKRGRR